MIDYEYAEYSPTELREMGIEQPACACLNLYREHDDNDWPYDVCNDCGAAYRVLSHRKVASW